MKKAIVLGCGMVGATIAVDLKRSGLDVTVADKRPEPLARVAAQHRLRTEIADLGDAAAVARVVAGHDVVVGALPSFLGLAAMRAVIEAGKPYCDISFLAEDPVDLGPLAEARGVTVVYDAGVSPGMSNVLIGWATAGMDTCDRIEILVGGLPELRRWPFQHKVAFSPGDLIEEYVRPARLVENGALVVREALSEPELIDFEGVGTLEAFNTDGLRSLLRTHAAVPSMREKTLRWPGHVELMRVFRATGLFSAEAIDAGGQRVRPIDVTAALLFPKITFAEGEVDLTVLRITVAGRKDGARVEQVWELLDRYDPATGERSMSRTTGFTASVIAQLMVEGRFVRPGVHPPEVVGREPGLAEAMLAEMEKRGVRYRERRGA
jgi:saccharopine dehydrogenase-like NADP-dependent oxidoreductase